jgi:hypothetical protein
MDWTPLIQTERGGLSECVHFGAVAVVDAHGRLLASAGNPQLLSFTRSTLKPLQALPFIEAGGVEHFKLESAQIALLCASHSGEDRHVAQVERLLSATRLGYKRLQCGCHTPYFVELGVKGPGGPYDERHHNCSGKHAGFLAYCVQHQLPLDNYLAPAAAGHRPRCGPGDGLARRAARVGHRRLLCTQLCGAAGAPGPGLRTAGCGRGLAPGRRRSGPAVASDAPASRFGLGHRPA